MEMVVSKIRFVGALVFALITWCTYGQRATPPPLERTITISFDNETVDGALKKIGQQAGLTFSYSPSVVKIDRPINANFINKTVRQILDEMFKGQIHYKSRGDYVILTKAEGASNQQKVSGYVIDEATGDKLKNVSIYDPVSLASAITDDYGYFQIEVPNAKEVKLAVRKHNYTDTLVYVPSENGLIDIRLASKKLGIFADSVGHKMKRFWLTTKALTQRAIMFENIEDSIHRKFQFSFVPFVGTNHNMSGHVINDFSVNMIGGYSLGVNMIEFGGMFNTVRGNVRGAQFAGLFNAVGGEVEGYQAAGLFNAVRGKTHAVQTAGLINFSWAETETVGIAGLINFGYKDSHDVRVAGLSNINFGNQGGPHVAGLFNFTTKSSGPAQLAGLFNFAAANVKGAQVAGMLNFTAGDHEGAQVSGLVNFAGKRMKGAQVGVLNFATKFKGTQIGLFNISDSTDGVPIGLLSIVGRGYHAIEISADEVFYTNVSFRTGVRKFYNILTAGIQPHTLSEDVNVWTFGYGVGTSPRLSNKFYLNIDVTANQIVADGNIDALNLLNKLYVGGEWRVSKNFGLAAGCTVNALVQETSYEGYPDIFPNLKPDIIEEHTYDNDRIMKMWFGAKVGLRFF
ncbi:hypothetical protein DQQ10_04980 [Pseudochryseolinea flava]|uniref:Secretin/TonB short N-terminal domain-containing protein n=2 Tax=Pseudochryseolinea flava TaxID=2059302 RepID=A0A364Y971_9BACT|nr:hypothetical protein DQQ10_04980 [Pseudochryseolinea flava]